MPRDFRPKRTRRPFRPWKDQPPKRGRYAIVDSSELDADWRPRHVFEQLDPRRVHDLEEGASRD